MSGFRAIQASGASDVSFEAVSSVVGTEYHKLALIARFV